MSDFLSSLAAWWTTWGPWIGAALIPTIITGLSLAPKLAPEATWVQKIWDVVKQIMGFLSVATPKDAPGTFKLPFKGTKKASTTAAVLILVFMSSTVNTSCAWFKSEAKVVENGLIDCAQAEKQQIEANGSILMELVTIAMQIYKAIEGGQDALEQEAISLGKQYGEPIVACVVDKLKAPNGKPMASEKSMMLAKLMANHNWKVKN